MDKPVSGFEFLEQLKQQNGKQTQNFTDLSRYLSFKAREKGIPFGGQFELTPLCNFDCKMCYVHLNPDQLQEKSILSVNNWKDLMHQAWEMGMCQATLTGGECLTYPGFDDLYLYLHSLGCQVVVLTNGFLLDEKRLLFFTEHKPARIQITLYGCNDDVYERVTGIRAFTRVKDNIQKAIDAGLPVTVSITPSSYLGEDVLETIRIAKQLTKNVIVNSALFIPRKETGRDDHQDNVDTEFYIKIYRLMNELNGLETKEIDEDKLPPYGSDKHECSQCGFRCGGGRSGFSVDWKGTLTPCTRMDMIHAYPLQEGFRAAWTKINKRANNWPRVPECDECLYHDVCNNCAANMLLYAEPGKQPTALCQQTVSFVKHGVRHIPECE